MPSQVADKDTNVSYGCRHTIVVGH